MRTKTGFRTMDTTNETDRVTEGPLGELLRQVAQAPECDVLGLAGDSRGSGTRSDIVASARPMPRVAGYELLAVIGHGAMGVVYRAVQTGTERLDAVKVIAGRRSEDAEYRRRFEREIRVLARL